MAGWLTLTEALPPEGPPEALEEEAPALNLDGDQRRLLTLLVRGEPVKDWLAEKHWMPTVAADSLNEALYDELGDSAVEWDGDELRLAEDYREDILRILGGNTK